MLKQIKTHDMIIAKSLNLPYVYELEKHVSLQQSSIQDELTWLLVIQV